MKIKDLLTIIEQDKYFVESDITEVQIRFEIDDNDYNCRETSITYSLSFNEKTGNKEINRSSHVSEDYIIELI